ncbi:MAG: PAS domain S-box protein, partial [Burkholderiaceae bacterium]
MKDTVTNKPTSDALARQLVDLRARLDEAEQTLDAIRNGDVDAVVVGSPSGQLVYTLENADRPYRVLIEQMQEGAVTLSEDGTVLYCNQRFATIIGVPRETILGVDIERFFAQDDAAAFIRLLGRPIASSVGEFTLRATSGRAVPVKISLVDLQIAAGMQRVICGVVTDLTHNRRRSEELAAANAHLAEEIDERRRVEDSLRLALEAADMGNWEIDLVTDRVRRSLRHDQIFGHARLLPAWSLAEALTYFLPEEQDEIAAAFDEAETTGSIRFERRIQRAGDGATRWISVRGRTYYEDGQPVRMAGVVSDVTDQRAIEEQLRQSQKMEAVGQLTGGIAHDFNNLLLVIGGSLDMLGRRIPVDERTTRLLTAARSGVARGAKLNHQLLAFSRRQDLQAEVLCIDDLVPTFEHLLDRAAGETVKVAIKSAVETWLCRTDPHQLETAILNLAINARDAMPDGGTLT